MAETGTVLSTGSGTVTEATQPTAAGNTTFEGVVAWLNVGGNAVPASAANPLPVADSALATTLGTVATAAGQASSLTQQTNAATALGAPADASYTSGSGSLVALLKGLFAKLAGTLTVQDAAAEASLSSVATSTGTVVTNTGTTATSAGAPADAAWGGSGSGSLVALLKGIYTKLAGTIAVSGSFTAAGSTVATVTATSVAITTQNTDQTILAANANRKSLLLYVNAAASVNINFGAAATTANLPIGQGSNFGYWRFWGPGDGVPTQAVHAISATAGTAVIVEEGA